MGLSMKTKTPPAQQATRTVQMTAYPSDGPPRPLSPHSEPGVIIPPSPGEDLVPLGLNLSFKVAQAGTYSSLGLEVRTTGLHADGNMEARQAVFERDVAWILNAVDGIKDQLNAIRYGLGMSGAWEPKGQPAPTTPTQPQPTPFIPQAPGFGVPG